MPHVATLKNAYRDRPPKKKKNEGGRADGDSGSEACEDPKKIPQSFTFLRREGGMF